MNSPLPAGLTDKLIASSVIFLIRKTSLGEPSLKLPIGILPITLTCKLRVMDILPKIKNI